MIHIPIQDALQISSSLNPIHHPVAMKISSVIMLSLDFLIKGVQKNMDIHFENRFGKLILTRVTEYVPVSTIGYETCIEAQQNTIDLETAEKVALITENRHIQLCLPMKLGLMSGFVIHHIGPHDACVCKVDIVSFEAAGGMSPSEQITSLAPIHPYGSFV
ncbi:MAG: hypothetical protein ACI9T7_000135 [Oleiphilaceae bacterium]